MEFKKFLVTGKKGCYTESKIAKTAEESGRVRHEMEKSGVKHVEIVPFARCKTRCRHE